MALKREVHEYCPRCGGLTAKQVGNNIHWKPCSKCLKPPGPTQPPIIHSKDSVNFIRLKRAVDHIYVKLFENNNKNDDKLA